MSASAVSRLVSWYSGAKVAQISVPYADQHMMNSHISATDVTPPHGPVNEEWRFDACQSPVRYGMMMKIDQRDHQAGAHTYVATRTGWMPKMLNSPDHDDHADGDKWGRPRWTEPSFTVQVWSENQRR